MSVRDVREAFARVAADGRITRDEIKQVFLAPGAINRREQEALGEEGDKFLNIMEGDARTMFRDELGKVSDLRRTAESINTRVARTWPALDADMQARLRPGVTTRTYGGSVIPDAVKANLAAQVADGASAYDVREMKADPVFDTEHGEGEMTIDGKYNPYAQEQRAVDTMAFDYTEITPEKLEAEANTVQTFKVLEGYDNVGGNQVARFRTVTQKGNPAIRSLYDEASWPDTKARGRGGEKYASNFAILEDGSLHCVPASRRTAAERWRILTTASLARGKRMLFNGHINVNSQGVVTYVGMSGRLAKMQRDGEAKFIDPVALLQAWGFKTAPGLKVTLEG